MARSPASRKTREAETRSEIWSGFLIGAVTFAGECERFIF